MWSTGCRILPLLRPSLVSLFSRPQLQTLRLFSSSSSTIYRHARPSTIRWQKKLENSANFIGTVSSPLKSFTITNGILGVRTQLKVEPPSGSKRFLTIFLDMWEDMAELSIQHLKPNDYIYVSGYLRSFTRASDNRNIILYPKVLVKEINFVTNNNQKANNIEDGESAIEKRRKRLYLWQVFFANPYEWDDLRKRKVNPSQPDFKHKGSGEALWLSPYDPPWVTRQLQLHDSRMGCVIAGNITPILREEAKIPLCLSVYVTSKEDLANAGSTKRPTCCVLVLPKPTKGEIAEEDSKN